jgi:hypothetical protein
MSSKPSSLHGMIGMCMTSSSCVVMLLQAGLMRKRIASINEAPIQPDQRRVAVEPPSSAPVNTWLAQQGLAGSRELPFKGGSEACY